VWSCEVTIACYEEEYSTEEYVCICLSVKCNLIKRLKIEQVGEMTEGTLYIEGSLTRDTPDQFDLKILY